jgi:hypothetical protein
MISDFTPQVMGDYVVFCNAVTGQQITVNTRANLCTCERWGTCEHRDIAKVVKARAILAQINEAKGN